MDIAAHRAYSDRLEEWQRAFQEFIASRGGASTTSTAERRTIALLEFRRQDISLNIRAVAPATGEYGLNPLKWDKYTDEFNDMVDNAAIALGLDHYGSFVKEPQFHLHLGVTVTLGSLVARCRDPYTRRKAIAVMTAQPVQEGIFNSEVDVKMSLRQLELEEGKRTVRSCQDIPVEARVRTSALHVDSRNRLVVQYTSRSGSWEEIF